MTNDLKKSERKYLQILFDFRRRSEMSKLIRTKLELAARRRIFLHLKAVECKSKYLVKTLNERYLQREVVRITSMYASHQYETQRLKNIEVRARQGVTLKKPHLIKNSIINIQIRKKMHEKQLERFERQQLKKRTETIRTIYRIQRSRELARALAINIKEELQSKMRWAETFSDEILRRFACMTKSFIFGCIKIVNEILDGLNIALSTDALVSKVIKLIKIKVVMVPEIGSLQCSSVQRSMVIAITRIADMIKSERSHSMSEVHSTSSRTADTTRLSSLSKDIRGDTIESIEEVTNYRVLSETSRAKLRADTPIVCKLLAFILFLALLSVSFDFSSTMNI